MSILSQLSVPSTPTIADAPAITGNGIRDRRHGNLPAYLFAPGTVGVLSESGRLIAEVALQTTALGLGQSAVLSGAEASTAGEDFGTRLEALLDDPRTAVLVLILDPHGSAGDDTIGVLRRRRLDKPVIVHIEGSDPQEGPRLADCSLEAERGACLATALRAAGVTIADGPAGIGLAAQAELTVRARPAASPPRFMDFAAAMRQVELEVYGV